MCNGSTTAFDAVSLGSSPNTPANLKKQIKIKKFKESAEMKITTTGNLTLNGKISFTETGKTNAKGTKIVEEIKGNSFDKDYVNNPKTFDYSRDDNTTETKELVFDNVALKLDGETTADIEGADLIKAVYKVFGEAFSGMFAARK